MAIVAHNDVLLDLLIEAEALNAPQAEELKEEQKRSGKPTRRIILDTGVLT